MFLPRYRLFGEMYHPSDPIKRDVALGIGNYEAPPQIR
ncbi:hypothetical protein SAMN05446934_1963 [Paraburkholderia hospita]|nr:hypothetical protein SAMN05446934_1963 [Paraburkholderia hospita]